MHCKLQHQLYNKVCIVFCMHYTASAWNYTVQSTCSNSLIPRLRGRRVSPLVQLGYEANAAKSDGACMFHDLTTQSSSWQCDQPWDSSSCLMPRPHPLNGIWLIPWASQKKFIACSWELIANFPQCQIIAIIMLKWPRVSSFGITNSVVCNVIGGWKILPR